MTDQAYEKAERDADTLSARGDRSVSVSQAIEAAVRTFNPKTFKP